MQLTLEPGFVADTVEHALQRGGEGVVFEFRGGERGDDAAHIGEAVTGEGLDLFEGARCVWVLGAAGSGVGEESDRGECLGDGVVYVAGDAGAFGDGTRVALGEREFVLQLGGLGLGSGKRGDETFAFGGVAEELQVAA